LLGIVLSYEGDNLIIGRLSETKLALFGAIPATVRVTPVISFALSLLKLNFEIALCLAKAGVSAPLKLVSSLSAAT
jgi:hypothetical protein